MGNPKSVGGEEFDVQLRKLTPERVKELMEAGFEPHLVLPGSESTPKPRETVMGRCVPPVSEPKERRAESPTRASSCDRP